MKALHIYRFVFLTVLASMGCMFGCYQACPVGGDSSDGNGGSSAAYVGQPCLWGGNGGGLTFPVCPEPQTSEFVGTIDGKPVDVKTSGQITAMAPPIHPPYSLSMVVGDLSGGLDLQWGDPYVRGSWVTPVVGSIIIPGVTEPEGRPVLHESQLLFSCDDYAFLYILRIDGGELTGCSR